MWRVIKFLFQIPNQEMSRIRMSSNPNVSNPNVSNPISQSKCLKSKCLESKCLEAKCLEAKCLNLNVDTLVPRQPDSLFAVACVLLLHFRLL